MITIITYDAKCKHCLFFKYNHLTKNDGSKSKLMRAFCKNEKSAKFNEQLTLKTIACNKIEL
jgi:hypothetical protein